MTRIEIDFSSLSSKRIRALHGVNSGPMTKAFTYDARELFREAGFPVSRLHDVEYPYGSGEFIDIPCIFKNFDADETLEENYNFSLSDEYIKQIIEVGSKPLFRLGVSIEHAPVKRYVFPPKDYLKWARICEHIILHYTNGWANGYYWDIKYWEIWNEADGGDNMWVGTPEEFYELYCVAAKHLKNKFPNLKIGGCGFTRAKNSFTEGFFKYISSKKDIPLDFYSWHRYFIDPRVVTEGAAQARELLDRYGYPLAENVFDEWNYMRDWKYQFDSYPIIKNHKGAAYCAAVLCTMQTMTNIDTAAYFEADVVKEWCGLFEVKHMAIGKQKAVLAPLKPFYSFKCFNALYAMKNEMPVKHSGNDIYACAASDEKRCGALITNYGNEADELDISLVGIPDSKIEIRMTDKDKTYEKIMEFEGRNELEIKLSVLENTVIYMGTPIDD